jgi:phosphoribosylformylglycinamidine synthase
MGDTIQKPGGDSAVVRIHGKKKAIAITVDSSTHYSSANPIDGGKQVVSECWRNLISVGSNPIAITNCLNFGNPEKEKIMGQFVETIDGISQACQYLNFPVVSGNVSFYNETQNRAISPTPTIGGVGLIKDINNMMTKDFKDIDNLIYVIGKTSGHLYQSEFFREVLKIKDGPPPEVNLFNEKNNGLIIKDLIEKKLLNSVHDVSSGGILLAISEMCFVKRIGAKIKVIKNTNEKHEYLFGEDQSRYIIEVNKKNEDKVNQILEKNDIFNEIIGVTQKDRLEIDGEFSIKLNDLYKFNSIWFNNYFKNEK